MAAAITPVIPQVAQAAPQAAQVAQATGSELQRITPAVDPGKPPQDQMVLAVIGDYGGCGVDRACASENQVADMVHSWNPAYILTVGDNSYQQGRPEEVVKAQAPYKADIDAGKFFPIMGNHDYGNGCTPESVQPSVDFFKVPVAYVAGFGNGLVDFLNPDVNCQTSSGTTMPPIYNQYKNTVDKSTAAWVLSGGHQPIYSSGKAGNNPDRAWMMTPGVDLILAGHDHHAEHIVTSDGYNIAITGNGGEGITPLFSTTPGSLYREATDFGAMRLTITKDSLKAEFVTLPGKVDYYFILKKDAQGKAYVAERSDWVDPNPDPGQNPTPNKYSVSFDLAADKTDGLTYKNYEDGPFQETTVDGRKALVLQKNSFGGANQLYMFVDDTAISGGPYAVTATFAYRSPVPGTFALQYDSATSGSAYQKSASVTIGADQVNQWQTASIDIPDIRFTNRENGGADMRLSAPANLPLAISGVKIDVAPPKPTVTHVSMDFSGEPNGLNWLPYESGPAHEITVDGRRALQVDKNTFNSGNNLYLVVDDKFIQGGPYDGKATIEYRSPVSGSFVLQYDSAATGSAYQSTTRVQISSQMVNTWQTVTLDMPQVMFRNRQNGNADMRIVGASNLPLIVGSMSVDIAGGEDEALEDALNAVAAAEAHPSAETIQAAEAAIVKLPAGTDADALTQRLNAVKAIVAGQILTAAREAVAAAEANPSAETIQAAEAAIAKLPAGTDADWLSQRLDVVKAIVQAQELLAGITSRDLTDQAAIDDAIADLAEARTIIDQLPEDHRGSLQDSATAAQRRIVEAITAVLAAPPQGKPAPIARPWLDLVIADTYDRYGKDNMQGQVMRVVTGHATGQEVKAAIEEFLAKR
ncbi:metallophosphoesterase [Planotetraspora phitsanulokensis]|uniref:metallophosphoesterase n=1 Tax=Planotetraspora phitsanulokensis TaxID=575192 RepID=UPI0019513B34|nr:metallophosphoesterase [Planotetraspora phitsanulokensis]